MQGTQICVFTVENSRPEKALHSSCTYLLWKFRNQGRRGTSIDVDTVETSRRRKAQHTHLRCYRGNLTNLCVLRTFLVVFLVSVET